MPVPTPKGAAFLALLAVVLMALMSCGGAASKADDTAAEAAATPKVVKETKPNEEYAGPPPAYEHELEPDTSVQDCVDCHSEGGDDEAPISNHAEFKYCQQCHVTKGEGSFASTVFNEN